MAGALVAGALLSGAFNVLFDRLANPDFLNFFRKRKHDESLLRKLKNKLYVLNKVLNDAEIKQINDQTVKDWMDELKDVVYQADDLLGEIAYEALRCKVEVEHQSDTNKAGDSLLNSDAESKLQEIIDILEAFVKEKDELGLTEIIQNWSPRLPSTSLEESNVYGRDNDKEEIIKFLLLDEASGNVPGVIPIVGMGGVGKTTLAQLVYNDVRLENHFPTKAWVCVSAYVSDKQELDVVGVTKSILSQITEGTFTPEELNQLQVGLKKKLKGKTFLIVLDDVWNDNYITWDIFKKPFLCGASGSKIIVTTRNQSVACIMQTVPSHKLQELSDEDCWSLFTKIAFHGGDSSAHPNLEKMGKKIVERCKGLPLAVKTLGSLLRFKLDVNNWNTILESKIWDLPEEKSEILPALRLSYHYLPPHLKQCFAYCSVFPKDYEFEKEKLVLMWIAQSFVQQPKGNKAIEKMGDEYFDELVSRSLFQQSSGKASSFVMHDLLHDLAEVVSGQFSFRLEDGKVHNISKKLRHYSYVRSYFGDEGRLKAVNEVKRLRTLLRFERRRDGNVFVYNFDDKVLNDMLSTLCCLRLLSLRQYQIEELPCWIGKLMHLRYLDLSHSDIQRLPESVCGLYNLQTLLLSDCHRLTSLPMDIGKLISLRHLDVTGIRLREMSMHINLLKRLHHLSGLDLGEGSGLGVKDLKELHCLQGKLSIRDLENVTGMDALDAKLKEKEFQELTLAWRWLGEADDSQNERDVLENLEPHANLKSLMILNYGGTRFPGWLGDCSFSNMESLKLVNCKYCFSLPSLGQLSSLKELTIRGMNGITKVGPEFYGDFSLVKPPFQSLEKLKFDRMSEWEEWCVLGAGEFSRLQHLTVRNCPKLTGSLPTHIIPSLVNLVIDECPELLPFSPLGFLTKLEVLRLINFEKSETVSIPKWGGLQNLDRVTIGRCDNIISFTQGGLSAPNLTKFSVWSCKKLKSLPERMHTLLPSLIDLRIETCPEIECFPEGGLPSNLRQLHIWDCKKLVAGRREWSINQTLSSLEFFRISVDEVLDSFPDEGLLPSSLTSFCMYNLPNLKSLNYRGLQLLGSLKELRITKCPQLEFLPEGDDWHKIAHIPHIYIDNKLIRCPPSPSNSP